MKEEKSNKNIILFLSLAIIVFFIVFTYLFGIREVTKYFAVVFISILIFIIFYRIEIKDQIYASCIGVVGFFFFILLIDYLINKTSYDPESLFFLLALYFIVAVLGFILKKDPKLPDS